MTDAYTPHPPAPRRSVTLTIGQIAGRPELMLSIEEPAEYEFRAFMIEVSNVIALVLGDDIALDPDHT